jgi:TPR repeat protein
VDGTLGSDEAARRDAPMVSGCVVAGARLLRSGHRGAAPLAAVELGLLYERRWWRGDAVRARALFQLAIDSGHEKAAPLAEIHLRGLNRRTRRGLPRAPRQATASQTKRAQD